MPKVSVIIVTYNQREYIGRAIEHALAQICDFDFEIIIGDDASTDGTTDICRDYARRFPDIIRLSETDRNRGVAGNYYRCVEMARGEYISDLGGDDFWTDNQKLQKEADFLDAHPDVSLVHTDWVYYNETDGTTSPSDPDNIRDRWHRPVISKEEIFLPLLQYRDAPIVHLCTAMYRRDLLLKEYLTDKELFVHEGLVFEDYQLIVTMAAAGNIGYIPDTTLCYSIGHPSLSSSEDYAKTYRLYHCTLLQARRMQLKYGVADADMAEMYGRLIHHIFAQAFHMHDAGRRREVLDLARTLAVKLPAKTRIMRLLSTSPRLWPLTEPLLHIKVGK